jgi:putative tRNA adenosine deaminase-associated protein
MVETHATMGATKGEAVNGFSDRLDDDRPGMDDVDPADLASDADVDEVDEDDDDYPDDATDDDIDLVVGLYREDGLPVVAALPKALANDLDELADHLRRLPADGGCVGLVSVSDEFFVVCRVRGQHVHVALSDAVAANDWPIARDVVDFLGIDIPDVDDDSFPVGDFEMLADLGLGDFDLEAIASNYDADSSVLAAEIADRLKFGPQYGRVVSASFDL